MTQAANLAGLGSNVTTEGNLSSASTLTLQTNSTTAITVDSSQRAAFVAGTAALPAITTAGDTNTGVFFPAADTIAFTEGGAEAMRINSSGNVGIGNTTAYNRLDVLASGNSNSVHLSNAANTDTGAYLNATGSAELMLNAGASYNSYSAPNFVMNAKSTIASGVYCTGDGIRFWVNTGLTAGTTFNQTERMRISAAGGLSVGTTSDPGAGAIYATGNITAFFSDIRLKNNEGRIDNALEKVSKLSGIYYTTNETAKEYGYTDESRQVGVIAQEVKEVLPEIVKAAPFDLDENGKSKSGQDYMTVQYDKLVPLLIEAIKELSEKVAKLEGK